MAGCAKIGCRYYIADANRARPPANFLSRYRRCQHAGDDLRWLGYSITV